MGNKVGGDLKLDKDIYEVSNNISDDSQYQSYPNKIIETHFITDIMTPIPKFS